MPDWNENCDISTRDWADNEKFTGEETRRWAALADEIRGIPELLLPHLRLHLHLHAIRSHLRSFIDHLLNLAAVYSIPIPAALFVALLCNLRLHKLHTILQIARVRGGVATRPVAIQDGWKHGFRVRAGGTVVHHEVVRSVVDGGKIAGAVHDTGEEGAGSWAVSHQPAALVTLLLIKIWTHGFFALGELILHNILVSRINRKQEAAGAATGQLSGNCCFWAKHGHSFFKNHRRNLRKVREDLWVWSLKSEGYKVMELVQIHIDFWEENPGIACETESDLAAYLVFGIYLLSTTTEPMWVGNLKSPFYPSQW